MEKDTPITHAHTKSSASAARTTRKRKSKPTEKKNVLRAWPIEKSSRLDDCRAELVDMTNVLLGRAESPADFGVSTMMEVANAYYARAAEMTAELQRAENDGLVTRGDRRYKFRTGELRTFMEMARYCIDLGSRRITMEIKEAEMSDEAVDS